MSNGGIVGQIGADEFKHWAAVGTESRFCGVRADAMDRTELLAFVGFIATSRETLWKRLEYQYKPRAKKPKQPPDVPVADQDRFASNMEREVFRELAHAEAQDG